jgi:hypothetical protein
MNNKRKMKKKIKSICGNGTKLEKSLNYISHLILGVRIKAMKVSYKGFSKYHIKRRNLNEEEK